MLSEPPGTVRGIIIIPDAKTALWYKMVKHFSIISRIWEGAVGAGAHLEACVLGQWQPVVARRDSLVLAFPRSSGVGLKKLHVEVQEEVGDEYQLVASEERHVLPTSKGAFVWAPPTLEGDYGSLYMLSQDYQPVDGEEDGLDPYGIYLKLWKSNWKRQREFEPRVVLAIDASTGNDGSWPSVEERERQVGHRVNGDELWVVSHLVQELPVTAATAKSSKNTRGYVFDLPRALSEMQSAENGGAVEGSQLAEMLVDAGQAEMVESEVPEVERAPQMRKWTIKGRHEEMLKHKPAEPTRVVNGEGVRQLLTISGARCEGCARSFPRGCYVITCRGGYACVPGNLRGEEKSCSERAKSGAPEPSGTHGSSQKTTLMREKFSNARFDVLDRCLRGECENRGSAEKKMECRGGCGRGLHALACAKIGKGFAMLGNLTCVQCRLVAAGAEGEPRDEVLRAMMGVMVSELTSGAESTAMGYAEYVRLELEFVGGTGAKCLANISMPSTNKESFKALLWWLVVSADRARSFDPICRSAGAYLTKTSQEDWTKHKDVKALMKSLRKEHGLDVAPMTHGTRRMLRLIMFEVLPQMFSRFTRGLHRMRWQICVEALGGLRVGEACGGGDNHGLLANNTFVLLQTGTTAKYVELKLEHSKTGFARYINMVWETSTSKIPVGEYTEALWASMGLKVSEKTESGFVVRQPDYWVVRISLLAVSKEDIARIRIIAGEMGRRYPAVAEQLSAVEGYLKQRVKSFTRGQSTKYVNVYGGTKGDPILNIYVSELEQAGLKDHVSVTPGPLLRATRGKDVLTHMPLGSSSTYRSLKKIMESAHQLANSAEDPDPELDLQGLLIPKWGHHSWRRFCDKVAREWMVRLGYTSIDIDLYMGWNELIHHREMQLHYAGMERGERVTRSKISMMA